MIRMDEAKISRWLRNVGYKCPKCGCTVVEYDKYADAAKTKYQTIRECMNPECTWQEIGEPR